MSAATSSSPSTTKVAPSGTPLPFHKSLFAGGVAGITELFIMYPLDVVKTRGQLHVGKGVSMLALLSSMIRNEGFGMYRGIAAPIFVEAPKRALKFATNERYKKIFTNKKTGELSRLGAVAAGVSAGLTEAFVVVSPELIKIRMQDPANTGLYKSSWDCAVKVFRNEGPMSLFMGLEATLWRHGLWNGGYFGIIHVIRQTLPEAKTEKGKTFRSFVAGALAGAFGTILNTPFDVAKTRIQNPGRYMLANGLPKYRWTLPAVATIAKEEGFAGLYKGFLPKVLRLGPGGGILLVVFDLVAKLIA